MKSASLRRGTTKKITTSEVDDEIGKHLSATTNEDENYDDIVMHHFETSFEKSIAPQKRARILGGGARKQRGTFGAGMNNNNKSSFFNKSTNGRSDCANLATSALLQQQQENYASSRLNSINFGISKESDDDDDDDDDESNRLDVSNNNIPADLRPIQNSHHSKPPYQHHQRSESAIPTLPSRSPFRLVRSASTHVPQRPKFLRRLQRSHSMALNHNVDDTNSDFWGNEDHTNQNDTELDAIERTMIHGPPKNARKLSRGQRRHSLSLIPHSNMIRATSTATISSTTSGSLSSSNMLHGSMTSFPDAIDAVDGSDFVEKKSEPSLFLSSSQLNGSNSSNVSPEPRSIGSSSGCRKRGVSSSSISDIEEYVQLSGGSLSSKRRNHSSEQFLRMFSPPLGKQLPPAPCLDLDEDFVGFDFATSFGRHRHLSEDNVTKQSVQNKVVNEASITSGRRERVEEMDQDTSIEEEDQSEKDTSPDSSFEAVDNASTFHSSKIQTADLIIGEDENAKIKRILDTMPTIDDLTFVICQLKDEECRSRHLMVGAGDMWKIAPPLHQWSSHRRATFIHWAKVSLGFIVRSAGMGYMYVQIHKKRGQQLVDLLEHAEIEFMAAEQKEHRLSQQPSQIRDETQVLFTSHLSNLTRPEDVQKFNEASQPSAQFFQRLPSCSIIDSETEELVDKISSLSMTSITSAVTTKLSQICPVTLPTNDEIVPMQKRDGEKNLKQLSIERVVGGSKSSRPSFDSHTRACDLSQHVLGHSPRMIVGRPPKGTTITIGYLTESAIVAGSTRHSKTPNADNLCFVTTPLTAKDRGWGSRPIRGKDWGTSSPCENELLLELFARFELSLETDDTMTSSTAYQIPILSLSQRDFDLEADDHEQTYMDTDSETAKALEQENVNRLYRKRISNYNKMKRMSLLAVNPHLKLPARQIYCPQPFHGIETTEDVNESLSATEQCGQNETIVTTILSFLDESELMTKAFPVCKIWSDCATVAHANLLVASIQCDLPAGSCSAVQKEPILEISWKDLHRRFPWACFLAEGGAKTVHKVYNSSVCQEEALSVMDTQSIVNVQIVANELAVSAMVSSLVRRGVCPNFVSMHRVFSCAYAPPVAHWGSSTNKIPKGLCYDKHKTFCLPKAPKHDDPGRYQYIQMQLANEGDSEELIKRQHNQLFPTDVARAILFQVSFALFAAAEKFSIKHYDVKLLNVFIQNTHSPGDLVLRYGLGFHIMAIKMPQNATYIAKLADFGTSNMASSTNGLPVTISHFTTLENTPPEYLILGDSARQGHSHDNFGLGLIMLHLFTGFRPYEEILEDVHCPTNFKERLRQIWENEKNPGYSVIRSVIFDGVDVDEYGNVEGDPDDTLYDTLYRYLVLFGIPKQFQEKNSRLLWQAIADSLQGSSSSTTKLRCTKKSGRKKSNNDCTTFKRDVKKYSIRTGTNVYISRARNALNSIEGGLDLLFNLCHFDPTIRATAMDVLNSKFMDSLREQPESMRHQYDPGTDVRSYSTFSTTNG